MDVKHEPDQNRFVVETDGGTALLSYRKQGDDVVNLSHTEVPSAEEGQGVGSALARSALEWARSEHLKVVPGCAFVRDWLKDHEEYSDLVVSA